MNFSLKDQKKSIWQMVLYLFVNVLFILKYVGRTDIPAYLVAIIYAIIFVGFVYLYYKFASKISQNVYRITSIILLGILILAISLALVNIDPYSVRVDRWSAVSFFLDAVFNGQYPYGAHTHVSDTNFPSPFPVWHFINVGFYLLGDVGIGLIFFLILVFVFIQFYFDSYRKTFYFFALLALSPAYWWEVAVRSDSLSNAFLVLIFIIWYAKKKYSVDKNFLLTVVFCGLIASTRLSAIIPVALFLFGSYIRTSWIKKIIFPLAILGLVFLTFLPFILWDVDGELIFFSRNPFMSQTSVGNPVILTLMIIAGMLFALKWKNTSEYFGYTASFIFLFILTSQLGLMLNDQSSESFFTNSIYDVSYFTLYLPYSIMYLTTKVKDA